MDKRLFKVTMLSVKRRWREVVRTFLAAFFAVFFVTGILLFEENMFEWQVATNKDRFGNWFIMEANVSKQSDVLKNHPKLSGYSEAYSALNLYDKNYNDNHCNIGYLSDNFLDMGCIDIVEGRLPQADNEVAMDWNTLSKHGITSPEIGQNVTIRYYEDNKAFEGIPKLENMVLVGILEDYSNVWYRSSYIPGAVVTKEKYESFDNERMVVYLYQLAQSERHSDYRAVYEEILKEINTKPAYNMFVYDYKPWSSDNVYNYMYVLVMVIGIAALTYQLVVYKNSRKYSNDMMRRLGATKTQITAITFVENVLMLLPAGLLGMGAAAITGKIVCLIIESQMGIGFYYISLELLLKGLVAILLSVLASEVASLILTIKQVLVPGKATQKKIRKEKPVKSTLSNKHTNRTISFRFTKANKFTQNLGVRIFSLGVCVVLIMCSLRIYTTYVAYESNRDNIDVNAVQMVVIPDIYTDYSLKLPYYVTFADVEEASDKWFGMGRSTDPIPYLSLATPEQVKELIDNGVYKYENEYGFNTQLHMPSIAIEGGKILSKMDMEFYRGRFYKEPRTNVTQGFSDYDISIIEKIIGIDKVEYSTYESQRVWSWDGMSIENMGYTRLSQERTGAIASVKPYSTRNIFATEYLEPTKELYDRLCKYIDPSMQDYDAFVRGEQVLVLMESNPYDEFDTTLTAGENISYNYYERGSYGIYAYDAAFSEYLKNSHMYEKFVNKDGTVHGYIKNEYRDVYEKFERELSMGTCVETKAAAVIHMTDDIRAEFADLLPNNSYYTAIASKELAEKACESQNRLMADFIGVDKLPDECQAKVAYNQMTVKYNMLSSFSATDNILSRYCEENHIDYVSYAAENEKYRTDFINAILQYGITIIAVIVINMLICAVVARNRLEARKARTELLLRLGAEKRDVRKIFMIEALRESLWCVFTLPIVLFIQYAIYRRNI
ncbi:MAG: ABC transporter permease [Lachnospira sp.]|nr:ABC transporter permease [Lachnospira sp.]